ncbi:unnamed protein product [Candidula unifasciata]|uniref:Globin n=1 Tax=Candidula unifasciata TaxID=100452 RepID=A0A8S3YP44_9EUPU|nr:unnamed protein product [Candidula unifasciata]
MGCGGSKKPAQPKVYDPTPDPITGLTEKDREMIVDSWKIIGSRSAIKQNALEFFLMLFAAYPYVQNYFGIFKNKQLSELRTSPKMRVHAASVFYYINSYVENIEDTETFMGLAEKMAVAHIARGITVEEFEKVRIVYVKFLPTVLGNKCTPSLEAAWDKLLKTQNAVFIMLAEEGSSDGDGSGGAESGSG